MEKISQKISDVLGDVPVRFEVDGKEYCIYPPTLGRELILGSLKKQLNIDPERAKNEPFEEVIKLCEENKHVVLEILAYSTIRSKRDMFNEDLLKERESVLNNVDIKDLATLFFTVITNTDLQDFIKHFGLDRDIENRRKIAKVRNKDHVVTFGGNSIFGGLIDFACARYGWTMDYVVWGINLTSLQMLFYDHTDSVCLTKEEWKAAHLKEGGAVINADDPANMKLIKSIFKD